MNVRSVLPKDAIPSVDDPEFGQDYEGEPDDEVIVLDADPPRAYPVRYLHYHEIVNDTVEKLAGDADVVPVAVTWCPLCGSAVVYDRRVEGRILTFGVSGKLADDDLVMYDRQTDSEWKQSRGVAIAGELDGSRLGVLPMSLTTWEVFRERDPDGLVMQQPGGKSEAASEDDQPAPIEYDASPYERYFEMDGFGLDAHRQGETSRSWDRTDLEPKTVVLGIEDDGDALGFPIPWVETDGRVVTDTVGSRQVVVFATPDGIHAFRNPGFEFRYHENSQFRADGTLWDGATGESRDGRQLERVPTRRLFAFAWQDDHGPASFYDH